MTPLLAVLFCLWVLLLVLAAAHAALATALITLREGKSGLRSADRSSDKIMSWLADPSAALSRVQSQRSLVQLLLASVLCQIWLSLSITLRGEPWWIALVLIAVSLLLGEFIPKIAAARRPASLARLTAPLCLVVQHLCAPLFTPLTALSHRLVSTYTPPHLKPREKMSSAEITTLIEMQEEQQTLTPAESALLQALVNLPGLTVKDAMTPRVDLPLMPHDAEDGEANNMLETTRHRFVAIFDMKLDAIAYLVDVSRWKLSGRPHWSTLTTTPIFAHETQSLLEAWREHLRDEASAVVVVDEFGGFEGLLTRDCLVELLFAKAAPSQLGIASVQAIGPGRYLVAGSTRLEEIERELDITLEVEGVDTIGGLVMNHFGYPPKPGELVKLPGLDIKVKRTARARVQQLELRVPAVEEQVS
jgi:putative hemolysin